MSKTVLTNRKTETQGWVKPLRSNINNSNVDKNEQQEKKKDVTYPEADQIDDVKNSKERIRAIKKFILVEEASLRKRMPWINHQNAIGLTFFVAALSALFFLSWAYLAGVLPWYVVIPIIGLPITILHELEHDLIHNLYFNEFKPMQHVMFAFIWLFKFHGNPWWRKDIHHWHHRVSGQKNDIEERIIGLGMKMDWQRLGITTHPLGFFNQVKKMKNDAQKNFDIVYMNRYSMATAMILVLFLKAFPIVFSLKYFVLSQESWDYYGLETIYAPVRDFMVILGFPLFIRQSCLVVMSTGCHYYGDIPKRNLFFQNQILDHWVLTPMQLYCSWFGASHIIHHYIPNQPFYMRFFLQKNVHAFMIKQGVRKNDWGIYKRANRFNRKKEDKHSEWISAILWLGSVVLTLSFYGFFWDFVIFNVGTKVVVYFFTWPIYRHFPSYKRYMEEKKKNQSDELVGVPKVY